MKKIDKEYIGKARKISFNFVEEIKLFILLALFAMVLGIFIKPVITEIEYINYVYSIFVIFILLFKIISLIYSVIFLIFFITLIYKKKKNGNK